MKQIKRVNKAAFLSPACTILLSISVAHGFNGVNAAEQGAKQFTQSITAASPAGESGILAWLESFLPEGIRFTGPQIGSKNQAEVLATASCYNSGAGVSCNGFKTMQEYLAAVNASENLGIPFEKLKARMQSGRTLHQAIHDLRPGANASLEEWKAEHQAQKTLKEFSS